MTTQKAPLPLDHRFTAPLEKDGAFDTFLTVQIALRKLIGKDNAGDEVTVHLEERFS